MMINLGQEITRKFKAGKLTSIDEEQDLSTSPTIGRLIISKKESSCNKNKGKKERRKQVKKSNNQSWISQGKISSPLPGVKSRERRFHIAKIESGSVRLISIA